MSTTKALNRSVFNNFREKFWILKQYSNTIQLKPNAKQRDSSISPRISLTNTGDTLLCFPSYAIHISSLTDECVELCLVGRENRIQEFQFTLENIAPTLSQVFVWFPHLFLPHIVIFLFTLLQIGPLIQVPLSTWLEIIHCLHSVDLQGQH